MVHRTFKLQPIDGRKTLDNHHVNEYDINGERVSDLISYTTRVASYNHSTNEVSVYNVRSKTTARHINAFLDFYGFDTKSMPELKKMI